MTFCSY